MTSRTDVQRSSGVVAVRTAKLMNDTSGPINANRNVPGPPAMDIGMKSAGTCVNSAGVRRGVRATTPTMVSQISSGVPPGRAGGRSEARRFPIGSCCGKNASASVLSTDDHRLKVHDVFAL